MKKIKNIYSKPRPFSEKSSKLEQIRDEMYCQFKKTRDLQGLIDLSQELDKLINQFYYSEKQPK
ncbi:Spo0E family sporulation regulatory protein-aspartic acid phosphatase [Amphibacillus marinus]|uniref:Spo0E family sporulation regulatory protein-aspartic acid phosphatase n=1 Tax=Amphibacillus marinus TaxID=872970 RepID=UPI000B85CBEE